MRAMMSSFQAATNRARQEGDAGGAQASTDEEPGGEPERPERNA
jgi:hypothetical protein